VQVAILGQGAGNPARPDVLSQPLARRATMDVAGIRECNRDVNVEQGPHRTPSASRRRSIGSLVTMTPLAGKGSRPVDVAVGLAEAGWGTSPIGARWASRDATVPPCRFFGGRQDVGVDVERGAHAVLYDAMPAGDDAMASDLGWSRRGTSKEPMVSAPRSSRLRWATASTMAS
jgi:hypothetical protein